jgi:hypothetical protein
MLSLVKLPGTKLKAAIFLSFLLFLPSSMVLALDYSAISATVPVAIPSAGAYSTGSLVNDSGTIYFIYGNAKIPFTNWQAFTGLGYSIKNVVNGNTSAYPLVQGYVLGSDEQDHPWGSWLLYNGTVYYYDQDGLIPVPSPEVFISNGGNWDLVLPANQYDLAVLTKHPNPPPLTDNDSRLSPATPNASLTQTDTSGQPFGFLDSQATTTPTSTPPVAAAPVAATGTIPSAPSSVTTSTPYTPSTPSQPNITLPSTAAAGLPITVTAPATDSSGSPLSYVFNWGDGSAPLTSSSSSATHTYAAAGNYTVSVTVVNSAGMVNSQNINVSVGPPQ